MKEKVDPYLRPLYDALYEFLGPDRVDNLLKKNIIEVAPLAFMRGRTLSDSFIILDEAQNTTVEQMKMFLTRLGNNSKMVVNGDVTQVDLPRFTKSGLIDVCGLLEQHPVEKAATCLFEDGDVVRNSLVQGLVKAYRERDLEVQAAAA